LIDYIQLFSLWEDYLVELFCYFLIFLQCGCYLFEFSRWYFLKGLVEFQFNDAKGESFSFFWKRKFRKFWNFIAWNECVWWEIGVWIVKDLCCYIFNLGNLCFVSEMRCGFDGGLELFIGVGTELDQFLGECDFIIRCRSCF
jgi:hypothetical protein